jgi:hypothetical protein
MKVLSLAPWRTLLLALGSAALFDGCCGATTCECNNYRTDALLFQFSPYSASNPTGFRPSEVDTILLVRSVFPREATRTSKPDTVRIVRARDVIATTPIVIDNAEPFAAVSGRKVGYTNPDSSYRYTIIVPDSVRRRPPLKRYYVRQVRLEGHYEGDGCCSCYRTTRKEFTLRDTAQPASSTRLIIATSAEGAAPVVTELKR